MKYPKEVLCWSGVYCSIFDLGLFGEILSRLDRVLHTFNRQKGGKIGRVGGYDDEGEEPPNTADYTTRHWPLINDQTLILNMRPDIVLK